MLSLVHDTLTHWGRVSWVIIGSDSGLFLGRCQATDWINAGILLFEPLGANFRVLVQNHTFSFTKMHLKMPSGNGDHFVSATNTNCASARPGNRTLHRLHCALTLEKIVVPAKKATLIQMIWVWINSVLDAFSVPNWSEIFGVVDVLTFRLWSTFSSKKLEGFPPKA